MRLSFRKNPAQNLTLLQILIIIVVFAIMIFFSCIFTGNIVREKLIRNAENVLALTEAEIAAAFVEPRVFLSNYSEIIRNMIINGEDEASVSEYIVFLTENTLIDSAKLLGFHAYFFVFDGVYLCGRNRILPAGFEPRNTSWFLAGLAANGAISAVNPYTDIITGLQITTFSRLITDGYNNPLGLIFLDFDLSGVLRIAANIKTTQNSYGVLLDSNLYIIAHQFGHALGRPLHTVTSGVAALAPELEGGRKISARRARNFMQENSVVFFRRIMFGWNLGTVIPLREYYRNIYRMTAFFILFGGSLAVMLCAMVYGVSKTRQKSDLRIRQKSNFLAAMSHEIRTPLNAIMGMTEIQMQNVSHHPSTSEAFIKINNSGNILLGLINDILDLSKIEAGNLELNPVKYEVPSLINDIIQLNYIRHEERPVDFITKVDENIPFSLVGDELRIKQIANHLLSNAFKYTEHGNVTFSVCSECIGRGNIVLVTLIFKITDTGYGMTQQQVKTLFDDFNFANMEANRSTEGAGLGLTITKNLLSLMQGNISVKSTVGEGTSVTVRLPQKTDGIGIRGVIGKELAEGLQNFKLANVIQIKKSQVTHEHMPYGKVLIVDDVETNLYVAKGLMSPYGLNIDIATSGFETIEKVKEGSIYDIIFMDHMMPKMDGIETARRLREMGYTYPIVALTANALAGQAEVFLNNGFDGFISKPIDVRQLNVSLNKLIRDKQPDEIVKKAQLAKAEFDKKNAPVSTQLNSQLAEIFARDAEKSFAVIEAILKGQFKTESDIQSYIINVHAMKSALANIGEPDVSAKALRLEQAGRDKNINVMLTETQNFLNDLCTVIEKIKPKEENTVIEDTKEALVLLHEKLDVIKTACESYDKKTAKNTLNELREQTWSQKNKELINKLAEHLLHSEFDSVVRLVEERRGGN